MGRGGSWHRRPDCAPCGLRPSFPRSRPQEGAGWLCISTSSCAPPLQWGPLPGESLPSDDVPGPRPGCTCWAQRPGHCPRCTHAAGPRPGRWRKVASRAQPGQRDCDLANPRPGPGRPPESGARETELALRVLGRWGLGGRVTHTHTRESRGGHPEASIAPASAGKAVAGGGPWAAGSPNDTRSSWLNQVTNNVLNKL